ncbi:CDP-glycerol glycerophosphotransferase [Arthrobacter crystallopoietes BAB-32]|uniref:CDP-glycerol glycerophosphotransferase n=1 Tax=Arthrobacter crystallopoietes BAB-32 TaxID=1246476 RepID=N1V584_9MICC|nr:CDP-glycerol glycerophosphotransferase [Arthrobacter crystallopoietes BAB-32]
MLNPGSGSVRRELRRLSIVQSGPRVSIGVTVANSLTPISIWALEENNQWVHLADFAPAVQQKHGQARTAEAAYEADLNLVELARELPPRAEGEQGATLTLFIEFSAAAADVPWYSRDISWGAAVQGLSFAEFRQLGEVQGPGSASCRAKLGLGRFLRTDTGAFEPVEAEENRAELYISRRGFLTLAINRTLKPYNAVYVHRLRVDGGVVAFTGRLVTRHGQASHAALVLLGRDSGCRFVSAADISLNEKATARRFGLREYTFQTRLDLGGYSDDQLAEESILDAWLEVYSGAAADPVRTRIGRTKYVARKLSRAGWQQRGTKTLLLTPYYTFKAQKTCFHLELLDTATFNHLRRRTRIPLQPQRFPGSKPVWLVGERPYKAQDTGLHFFRYLRTKHPEIDAYYVIDPKSPERRNLDGLGNVVAFGSRHHFDLALRAERFIGSHHPDFLYPTWMPQFRRAAGGIKVFLQHGVMGTKWMVPNYGKKAPGFDTDLFIVSSEREKEYIVDDFGYPAKDVVVTGLSRFDALFAGDVEVKKNQILVIPTWRDWLFLPELFTESEYFQTWSGLLHDERLRTLATEHNAEIVFCLHPNMQQYRSYFADAPARVISQGEIDVQHLLKESAVLVTDYSSVGFDFSFLDKPVHYFQFDRERFLGPKGSHLDLDAELPGRISFNAQALLAGLEQTLDSGCTVPDEYVRRSRRFLKFKDRSNSARIFEAVRDAKPATSRIRRIIDPELGERLFGKYRRSRFYFPSMRRFYAAARRLPMDENLIVFESGLGKQYADSPRYIYEELVRRKDPRRKVWVYTGKLPVKDPNTKVVKRLSPQYYWYLARAKYWVNNQNFPYYIRRRSDGIMVQTWHGTPLKRMLHDLNSVHGRDEWYLDRVSQAVRQWSVLLSPSPYATAAFRSAFRFRGPVLETGYPRNDPVAGEGTAELGAEVRRRLGIPEDKRVVLYAPTFRDSQSSGAGRFHFEMPFDLQAYHERFGTDTMLLLRMHVLVSDKIAIPDSVRGSVMDVSGYPEIQELCLASDVLVTDYSSVFFDYAILRRPIVFYAYDLELYRDTLRGFYLDYGTELPGPVVESEADLHAALEEALKPDVVREGRLAEFAATYAPHDDGHAAARVVDDVFFPAGDVQRPGQESNLRPRD